MKARKERAAREEREAQKAREEEVVRLNRVALAAGYAGYEDINILSMIGKTQREGGLEEYVWERSSAAIDYRRRRAATAETTASDGIAP